jgi:GGDEF domain-containing protein
VSQGRAGEAAAGAEVRAGGAVEAVDGAPARPVEVPVVAAPAVAAALVTPVAPDEGPPPAGIYAPALVTDAGSDDGAPDGADGEVLRQTAEAVRGAAAALGGWRTEVRAPRELAAGLPDLPDARVVVLTSANPNALREAVAAARKAGVAVVMGCGDETARRRAAELRADDWYVLPGTADEVAARIRTALTRGVPGGAAGAADRIERAEYEQLLYDARTGLPTLPVAIERSRAGIQERGEVVMLYLNFVRYSKLEEIYGWEKLDAVLETTAEAIREYLGGTALSNSRALVTYTNDADVVLFHVPAAGRPAATDAEITELSGGLAAHVAARIEAAHGEDVAALFDIYVGVAHVYHNPKVRLERLIYRGIREAANAAKSVADRSAAARWPTCGRACATGSCTSTTTRSSRRRRAACSATRRWRAG